MLGKASKKYDQFIYTFEYGGYTHKIEIQKDNLKISDFLTEEIIYTYKAGNIAVLKKKEKVVDGKPVEVSLGINILEQR